MPSPIHTAYDKWWDAQCIKGDPARIPNPTLKGFEAGWEAATNFHLREQLHASLREEA